MSNDALGLVIVVIAVGVVCGVIAGLIAVKKGRSQGAFFLVGFFFGPLGILATILIAPGPPPVPSGMWSVTCPRCSATQNIDEGSPEFKCWQCKLVTPVDEPEPTGREREDWRGWLHGPQH